MPAMPRRRAWLTLLIPALALLVPWRPSAVDAQQAPAKKAADAAKKRRADRNVINTGPIKDAEPPATPVEKLKIKPGFKVELLYSVPKEGQGSWVSMCTDPKGRLIVCDQYGGLFRVTPPPLGAPAGSELKVEPIPVDIGEAQGLLWAFDSLYVVVNRGQKYESGLYRVRDTNSDDMLDKVESLRKLNGGGEHGPHAVMLNPDGKNLTIVCGNNTALTDLSGSLVPPTYGEDSLLPRMVDGNGFMAGEKAPGGCVYHVTPDGKEWTLVAMGFRNEYDAAYSRNGELFTYDSDMEWDMNTPWYRPTRVCQVTSGADFGYRNGAGKFPAYYLDSLPPTVNIGPGSPTGVCFGYGARFPAKYQDALFICDWSYGKLYAVHLKPNQSHEIGELEEFITGTPLPLTDILVNPKDGAMYFAIGGRRTKSGLYRVTYNGPEPTTAAAGAPAPEARALRHKIEAFHGHQDPRAVETVWPDLAHADRFIRFAARIAVEFQPLDSWKAKALAETRPEAALNALLALVRVSTPDPAHRKPSDPPIDLALRDQVLKALAALDPKTLDEDRQLDLLRVYAVTLHRMGRPDEAATKELIARLGPLYPAKSRELNSELSKLLVFLGDPQVAAKSLARLAKAPTQEEQIDLARDLRVLEVGWTPALRKQYFEWFSKGVNFKGGSSFAGFIRTIRNDAMARLSEAEKTELAPLLGPLARNDANAAAKQPPRPLVKAWTAEELSPIVENGLKGRDFDRGRELFAAAQCFACHRYANEGGAIGPDLTGVVGRFSPRDLLESIIQPSKSVSDQYQAVTIATTDGRVITGRIVNLNSDNLSINTDMLDPNAQVNIDRKRIEEMKPSPVSMMPEGLLNSFNREELLDLLAFLFSSGDRKSPMFH